MASATSNSNTAWWRYREDKSTHHLVYDVGEPNHIKRCLRAIWMHISTSQARKSKLESHGFLVIRAKELPPIHRATGSFNSFLQEFAPTDSPHIRRMTTRHSERMIGPSLTADRRAEYVTDYDLDEIHKRSQLGLPDESPIWPISDAVDFEGIQGFSSPFGYMSNKSSECRFALHSEDALIPSINFLWKGHTRWMICPESELDKICHVADQVFRPKHKRATKFSCSQKLKHFMQYWTSQAYTTHNIKVFHVDQSAGDAIVVLAKAAHQGVKGPDTVAEAINFAFTAELQQSIAEFKSCGRQACGNSKHVILKNMLVDALNQHQRKQPRQLTHLQTLEAGRRGSKHIRSAESASHKMLKSPRLDLTSMSPAVSDPSEVATDTEMLITTSEDQVSDVPVQPPAIHVYIDIGAARTKVGVFDPQKDDRVDILHQYPGQTKVVGHPSRPPTIIAYQADKILVGWEAMQVPGAIQHMKLILASDDHSWLRTKADSEMNGRDIDHVLRDYVANQIVPAVRMRLPPNRPLSISTALFCLGDQSASDTLREAIRGAFIEAGYVLADRIDVWPEPLCSSMSLKTQHNENEFRIVRVNLDGGGITTDFAATRCGRSKWDATEILYVPSYYPAGGETLFTQCLLALLGNSNKDKSFHSTDYWSMEKFLKHNIYSATEHTSWLGLEHQKIKEIIDETYRNHASNLAAWMQDHLQKLMTILIEQDQADRPDRVEITVTGGLTYDKPLLDLLRDMVPETIGSREYSTNVVFTAEATVSQDHDIAVVYGLHHLRRSWGFWGWDFQAKECMFHSMIKKGDPKIPGLTICHTFTRLRGADEATFEFPTSEQLRYKNQPLPASSKGQLFLNLETKGWPQTVEALQEDHLVRSAQSPHDENVYEDMVEYYVTVSFDQLGVKMELYANRHGTDENDEPRQPRLIASRDRFLWSTTRTYCNSFERA